MALSHAPREMPPRTKAGAATAMSPRHLLAAALVLLPVSAAGEARRPEMDRERLEVVEERTESLAGDLVQLAADVGRRDLAALAGHFAEGFAADSLPSVPGSLQPRGKWVFSHAWTRGGPPESAAGDRRPGSETAVILRPVSETELVAKVQEVLSHFSEIEDIRLDVLKASFPDPEGEAGEAVVALALVGRDGEGRREWLKGRFEIAAERADGNWRLTRWHTAFLDSLVSSEDLFSEVTVPAGIDRSYPRLGVPPNEGFVPHGGAVGDADGDGLMDLLLTEVDGARLYVNDGKGAFRDVSESTLLRDVPRPTGAVFLDHDQDGDADIFMSAVGKQMLFENRVDPNGIRRFYDVSETTGVAVPAVGLSVAVADVNGDGLPDIYVASSNHYGSVMPNSWSRATNGTPNLLFINIGSGRYRESARSWGVDDRRWGTAAAFADINGDGWQDLYVVNAFGENALYINKRTRFEDEAARRGVRDPGGGRGAAWGDYDNDGHLDLHVTNTSSTAGERILGRLLPGAGAGAGMLGKLAAGNSLFRNRGSGWFTSVAGEAGPFEAGWAYGGGFIDFDNDGWEDEFTVNGFVSGNTMQETRSLFWRHVAAASAQLEKAGNPGFRSDHMDRIFSEGRSFSGHERDCLFMSLGDGTFRDISGISGIDSVTDGRSAIFADFDNDGDYDIVTTTAQKTARLLYRNNVGQRNAFVRITLQGTRSGRDAFGAVVRVKTSRGIQSKVKSGGSGFLSVHDPRLLFGLGGDQTAEWLEVTWPSGLKQRAGPIQAGDSLRIVEGAEATQRVDESRFRLPDPPERGPAETPAGR